MTDLLDSSLARYPGPKHAFVFGTDDMERRHVYSAKNAAATFRRAGFTSVTLLCPEAQKAEMDTLRNHGVHPRANSLDGLEADMERVVTGNTGLVTFFFAGHGNVHASRAGLTGKAYIHGDRKALIYGQDITARANRVFGDVAPQLWIAPQCYGYDFVVEGLDGTQEITAITASGPNNTSWPPEKGGYVGGFVYHLLTHLSWGTTVINSFTGAAVKDESRQKNSPSIVRVRNGECLPDILAPKCETIQAKLARRH